MAAKENKFPKAQPGDRLMQPTRRSLKDKLLSLVNGNPAFEGFEVNDAWSVAELESAIKDHMRSAGVQPISPRTNIEAQ